MKEHRLIGRAFMCVYWLHFVNMRETEMERGEGEGGGGEGERRKKKKKETLPADVHK